MSNELNINEITPIIISNQPNHINTTYSPETSSSTSLSTSLEVSTQNSLPNLSPNSSTYSTTDTDNIPLHEDIEYIGNPEYIDNQESINCLICLEEIDNYIDGYLPCGCSNKFHQNCLIEWILVSGICPICRNGPGINDYLNDDEILYNFIDFFSYNTSPSTIHIHRPRQHVEVVSFTHNYCGLRLNRLNKIYLTFFIVTTIMLVLKIFDIV